MNGQQPPEPPGLPPLSTLVDALKIAPSPLDMDISIDLVPGVEIHRAVQADGSVAETPRQVQIIRVAINDPSGVDVFHFQPDTAEQIGQALIKRATAARTGLQVVDSQTLIRGGGKK